MRPIGTLHTRRGSRRSPLVLLVFNMFDDDKAYFSTMVCQRRFLDLPATPPGPSLTSMEGRFVRPALADCRDFAQLTVLPTTLLPKSNDECIFLLQSFMSLGTGLSIQFILPLTKFTASVVLERLTLVFIEPRSTQNPADPELLYIETIY